MFATVLALVLVQRRFGSYTCPIPGGYTNLSTKDNQTVVNDLDKNRSVNPCHTMIHSEHPATVSRKPLHPPGNGSSEHPATTRWDVLNRGAKARAEATVPIIVVMQLPIMVSALHCTLFSEGCSTAGRVHTHLAEYGKAVRCVTGTVDGRTTKHGSHVSLLSHFQTCRFQEDRGQQCILWADCELL